MIKQARAGIISIETKEREEREMTIRELIDELNAMVAEGVVDENARVRNAENDDIYSICESVYFENEVIIYF